MSAQQSAEMTLDGTLMVGDVVIDFAGEALTDAEGDSYMKMIVFLPDGVSTTTEEISVGDDKFRAVDGGPFVIQPPGAGEREETLTSFLRTAEGLVNLGTVTSGGRPLHRLGLPPGEGPPLSALGFDDEEMRDASANVEFYVQADGTPVLMSLTAEWSTIVGREEAPAAMEMELSFDSLGGPAAVSAPADAWQAYPSEQYAILVGHPGWEATPGADDDPDTLDSEYGDVLIITALGRPLNLVDDTRAFVRGLRREVGASIDGTIDETIAGRQHRLVSLAVDGNSNRLYVGTSIVDGRFVALTLVYINDPSNEGLDLLRAILTTVQAHPRR